MHKKHCFLVHLCCFSFTFYENSSEIRDFYIAQHGLSVIIYVYKRILVPDCVNEAESVCSEESGE